MKWIKQYTDIDGHPQVQRAGFWAARVFELLCRVCGQYELGGVLPPRYLHADWLARRWMLVEVMPVAEAEALIARSIERLCDPDVGLLERLPDGSVRIDGWARLQGSTSAERMRQLRARRRAAETCDVTSETRDANVAGSDVTVASRDVTVTSRVSPVTSRVSPVTHVTLKREEREENTPPLPPPTGGACVVDLHDGDRDEADEEDEDEAEMRRIEATVLRRIGELTGCYYGQSVELQRRIRDGATEEELLALVEDQWEREFFRRERRLFRPSVLFGRKYGEYLAQARARLTQPRRVPAGFRPFPEWD